MPGKVFINGCFLVHQPTGIQRYAWEISRRIVNMVDFAELIVPKDLPIAEGYDFTGLRKPTGIGSGSIRLWEQLALPRLIGKNDALWTPAGLGPLFARSHLLTVHDLSVLEQPTWFSRSYAMFYRAFQPQAIRRATAVSAVSAFTKQRIQDILGVSPNKISVVGNAVSEEMTVVSHAGDEDVRDQLGISGRYILAVGSLEPRKNLDRLVAAFALIEQDFPDLSLVIVGSHRDIYARVELGKRTADKIHLTGYVRNEQLGALYRGSTVFAYPSIYEGFGIPPLEAMACGVPVLTSNVTALPEVVGEAAITVDPTDVSAIANGLKLLVSDQGLRARCISAGLARAASFSWDKSASEILRLLLQISDVGAAK